MQVTTPSDHEIVLVQTFAAPRAAVFDALTDPEQLTIWQTTTALSLVSCEVDLRVGGRLRYVFERPNGRRIEVRGTFSAVEPPHRFAYAETYDFSALEVQVTTVLAGVDGGTTLTQTLRYASQAERDEDYPGVTESAREIFANLDRYLKGRESSREAPEQRMAAMTLPIQRVVPALRITDYLRSKEFYEDQLGFRIEWEHRFEPSFPVFMSIARDGMQIYLTEHRGDCQVGGLVHFVIEDVDAWFREFTSRGVTPTEAPNNDLGFRNMTVTDPDGNQLRFMEPSAESA